MLGADDVRQAGGSVRVRHRRSRSARRSCSRLRWIVGRSGRVLGWVLVAVDPRRAPPPDRRTALSSDAAGLRHRRRVARPPRWARGHHRLRRRRRPARPRPGSDGRPSERRPVGGRTSASGKSCATSSCAGGSTTSSTRSRAGSWAAKASTRSGPRPPAALPSSSRSSSPCSSLGFARSVVTGSARWLTPEARRGRRRGRTGVLIDISS